MQLSKETRKDPSMTGRMRRKFTDSLIRIFTRPAASVDVEEATEIRNGRIKQVVDKHLRQGYLAGQIYAAVVLRQYKPPFKPTIDEDALSNIIVNAQIALEDMLDGSNQTDANIITVLTTRFMDAFNRGVTDFSRMFGATNFRFLSAATCCNDCNDLDGEIIPSNQLDSFAPPQHDSCMCILIPLKGL